MGRSKTIELSPGVVVRAPKNDREAAYMQGVLRSAKVAQESALRMERDAEVAERRGRHDSAERWHLMAGAVRVVEEQIRALVTTDQEDAKR